MNRLTLAFTSLISLLVATARAEDTRKLPLILSEEFEQGADRWQPTDPSGWKLEMVDGKKVFSQHKKNSDYKPPHRSPLNFALLKDVLVGDFQLDANVKSTHSDYDHRDVCLFFGYQDPANFYYVHLGKQTDDRANQIFIVDDQPRTKISTKTSTGTAWDDNWHHLRVIRRTEDGAIEIYFDDMNEPVMTATDKTFAWGQVGIGTFDDTSAWNSVELRGVKVERPQ
jgi:hypothetical protein